MASKSGTASVAQTSSMGWAGAGRGGASARFCAGSLGSRSRRRAVRSLKPALAAAVAWVSVRRSVM